jgi:ribonucleoside-diphosphate reductase alpha chain
MDIPMLTVQEPVKPKAREYLKFERKFTTEGIDPLDTVLWTTKNAVIKGSDGKERFRQDNIEVPASWEDNTISIVVEKYFRVVNGVKEHSAKQMFTRVASWITYNGIDQGLFSSVQNSRIFYEELLYLLAHGMYAFNSPVWFNAGAINNPQCSACFINSVEDTMESILDLQRTEVTLFRGGSGAGSNLSNLRSSWETLSRGGYASGPVSFMKGYDSWAGVTKSGGTTRRAAKLSCLNMDHPDILEQKNGLPGFITCKSDAELQAHALYSTGKYSAEFNVAGNVYDRTLFQNANHSVRVTDEFMQAVIDDKTWSTKLKNGETHRHYSAKKLFEAVAEAAWICGDPGIQFHTSTNEMHTCPNNGRINASNPCQPSWATVLTKEGIRTFADIKIGTEIWSGTQWTKVVRKVATGVKPVYQFYTRAGIFAGTEEHRVISNGERIEARFADNIDTAQGHLTQSFLMDVQTIVDGLVFGDGYVKVSNDGNNHYPLLCVGKNDQSYFSDPDLAEFINSTPFDVLSHRVKTTLTREELPKTYLRQIPDRYFGGDVVKVTSFLRGLYSANGSVVGKRITLKAASFGVISQVQEMLSSLGIRSYYTVNRPTDVEFNNGVYTSKESYDLNICSSRDVFCRWIGFIQPYKQEKLANILKTEPSPRGPKTSYEIVSRQLVSEEPVWDIEVESDEHTYWTGGLLVSNCSEYLFLDDTACNLGSLNLMKFLDSTGNFEIAKFKHAVDVAITAKEIIVDASSYPTEQIAKNSHKYRTLGLGFTNLGALLTFWGLPYDSEEGRKVAGAIASVMGGEAYLQSAKLAEILGPFEAYSSNNVAMMGVIKKHLEASRELQKAPKTDLKILMLYGELFFAAEDVWVDAYNTGDRVGFRNAQVTVIAPTGTISFLMGADTTGIEPMLGVVTYKKAIGEGFLVLPNNTIKPALKRLGYSDIVVERILQHIVTNQNIHTAPDFDKKHGSIFAEALGEWALKPEAHVDMMAAVQPFISGGISKTVNMPNKATKEDIAEIYLRAWRSRLKCVAVYRDGCKMSQPISTKADEKKESPLLWGARKKLSKTRAGKTHSFRVSDAEGYLTANVYPDGTLGEIFVRMSKQGSFVGGIIDSFAINFSMALQSGTPLDSLVDKFKGTRFEPSGFTGDPTIPIATSILDYIVRWLELEFLKSDEKKTVASEGLREFASKVVTPPTSLLAVSPSTKLISVVDLSGNPCRSCGGLTKRTGSCYTCMSCGDTTGCG